MTISIVERGLAPAEIIAFINPKKGTRYDLQGQKLHNVRRIA